MADRLETEVKALIENLKQALAHPKCYRCRCLINSLNMIEAYEEDYPSKVRVNKLVSMLRERVVETEYDCLGCKMCFGAELLNAFGELTGLDIAGIDVCRENVQIREGWPPLSGNYHVLKYGAPVAICTLNSHELSRSIYSNKPEGVSIVGTLETENLGVERIIWNTISNPHIRFLIVCGTDSENRLGHLSGQSLISLFRNGVDQNGRIRGARGKNPFLKNIPSEGVLFFTRNVKLVEMVNVTEVDKILEVCKDLLKEDPGPSPFILGRSFMEPIPGKMPDVFIPDPAGYFVIYIDWKKELLVIEHYGVEGTLTHIIEGSSAEELYTPAVEKGMVSRLDHAAYLGRELARAEAALRSGLSYRQDGVNTQ